METRVAVYIFTPRHDIKAFWKRNEVPIKKTPEHYHE